MFSTKWMMAAALTVAFQAQTNTTIKMMSYNVQNLFDTVDSPDTDDSEFTPKGAQKWTENVIRDKLHNLGEVISSQNPDFVTMTEVENQGMVERLAKEGLAGKGYNYVFAGPSDDNRGIRNAIISKLPIKDTQSHRVWRDSWGGQKTRDILEVTLVAGQDNGKDVLVTVLVNHWPSRGGGPARDPMRLDVAEQMTAIAKDIVTKDPDRLLISAGDFNDELGDKSMSVGVPMVNNLSLLDKATPGTFFAIDSVALSWKPQDRGTFFYKADKTWNNLDHILVTEGASLGAGQARGFHYLDNSFTRVKPMKFVDTKTQGPNGCEINPKFNEVEGRRGDNCPFGASDHFPLAVSFELR